MSTIRRTVYGAAVQTAQPLQIPVPAAFMQASSLNTTLGIQPSARPSAGEQVAMRYFVIGIGAHAYTTGQRHCTAYHQKPHCNATRVCSR